MQQQPHNDEMTRRCRGGSVIVPVSLHRRLPLCLLLLVFLVLLALSACPGCVMAADAGDLREPRRSFSHTSPSPPCSCDSTVNPLAPTRGPNHSTCKASSVGWGPLGRSTRSLAPPAPLDAREFLPKHPVILPRREVRLGHEIWKHADVTTDREALLDAARRASAASVVRKRLQRREELNDDMPTTNVSTVPTPASTLFTEPPPAQTSPDDEASRDGCRLSTLIGDHGGSAEPPLSCNMLHGRNRFVVHLDVPLSSLAAESSSPLFDNLGAANRNLSILILHVVVEIIDWDASLAMVFAQVDWSSVRILEIITSSQGKLRRGVFSSFSRLVQLSVESTGLAIEGGAFGEEFVQASLLSLDLSSCGLRTSALDRGVFAGLTALQQLLLGNNQLTSVSPGWFSGQYNQLQTFSLNNNLLTSAGQQVFATMPGLTVLRLDHNLISGIQSNAFAGLSSLRVIDLSYNQIEDVRAGAFNGLMSLREIGLHNNFITMIHGTAFTTATSLDSLRLDENRLTSLSPTAFAAAPLLSRVSLHGNMLESLPATLFARTPLISILYLDNNRLRSLPKGLFSALSALRHLWLTNNQLTQVPDDLLSSAAALDTLRLENNMLTTLPTTLFRGTRDLYVLRLSGNRISHLPDTVFAGLSGLSLLQLNSNRLTHVSDALFADMRGIVELWLSDNELMTIATGALQHLTRLQFLFLSNNRHLTVATELFRPIASNLVRLHADNTKRFIVSDGFGSGNTHHFGGLTHLGIEGADVPDGRLDALLRSTTRLEHLRLGWAGLSEKTYAFSRVCSHFPAGATLSLLSVAHSSYASIELCPTLDITAVFLRANPLLQRVFGTYHVQLDAADSVQLTELHVFHVDLLGISRTNVQFSPHFCSALGGSLLTATGMTHASFAVNAERLLQGCFQHGRIFDFSHNAWLSDIALVERVASVPVVLGTFDGRVGFAETRLDVHTRDAIPLVILEGTAIDCSVVVRIEEVVYTTMVRSSVLPATVYEFACDCSVGHTRSGNTCVSTALTRAQIAGIAVGSTALAVVVIMVFVYRWRVRTRREKYQLIEESELKEQLLGEEVEALKKAWLIELGELDLDCKLDEGAFGEVWKAQWDGLSVAVKFMKYASLGLMDPIMLNDFDKELEFLRRTRHPHLVRFFGTGIDSHDAPFLVLEFIDLGSLKSLIFDIGFKSAFEAYLTGAKNESSASQARMHPTVLAAKLSLMNDVAKGMAFLHSINVMHRDLKSGNVLVTKRLIAKITDFGSMSGKLRGGMHGAHPELKDDVDGTRPSDWAEFADRSEERRSFASTRFNREGLLTNKSVSNSMRRQEKAMDSVGDTVAISGGKTFTAKDKSQERVGVELGGNTIEGLSASRRHHTVGATMTAGVGTPLYMAPEVLDLGRASDCRQRLTRKADVFSFGVLMWEVAMCLVPDLTEQEALRSGSDGDESAIFFSSAHLLELYKSGIRLRFDQGGAAKADDGVSDWAEEVSWYAQLAGECMSLESTDRPTFAAILKRWG